MPAPRHGGVRRERNARTMGILEISVIVSGRPVRERRA